MYSRQWTQFETQSLAYGLLRKALYPNYLVRGDQGKINIYKPTDDHNNPTFLRSIEIQASMKKGDESFSVHPDGVIKLVGGTYASNIVELIKPYI